MVDDPWADINDIPVGNVLAKLLWEMFPGLPFILRTEGAVVAENDDRSGTRGAEAIEVELISLLALVEGTVPCSDGIGESIRPDRGIPAPSRHAD